MRQPIDGAQYEALFDKRNRVKPKPLHDERETKTIPVLNHT